jgi:hypothetical protein
MSGVHFSNPYIKIISGVTHHYMAAISPGTELPAN